MSDESGHFIGHSLVRVSCTFFPFIPRSFSTRCVLTQYVFLRSPPPSPSAFLGEVRFSNISLCPWPAARKWACWTESLNAPLPLDSLSGTSGFHREKYNKPRVDHRSPEEHTDVGQRDPRLTPQPSPRPPVSPRRNCGCVGVPLRRPGEPSASAHVLLGRGCAS